MPGLNCEVAIIGAGPYGLSAAAHLRSKADVRVFGKPMGFWRNNMPKGMVLRSLWRYSHISDPHDICTVDSFARVRNLQLPSNLLLEQFLNYGEWFQRKLVPEIDLRMVNRIELKDHNFLLVLGDGSTCTAHRVVVATGLACHLTRPEQFQYLPRTVCTHASEHSDFARFAGRRVAVIGGGQAALESAVLLREAGADPEIIARAPCVHWLGASDDVADSLRRALRPLLRQFMAPPLIGTFPLNLIVQRPGWFRFIPGRLRRSLAQYVQRPNGALWLLPRAAGLPVTSGVSVASTADLGSRIDLKLDDGSRRSVDHVLLATGYRFDLSNLPFLTTNLLSKLRSVRGYPLLSGTMESSIPHLHFIGAAAADRFGPVMRFVYGTRYASRSLTRGVFGERVSLASGAPDLELAET